MNRYVTYIEETDNFGYNDDHVQCFSQAEYKTSQIAKDTISDASEYVWQFAETKQQAINQHFDKFEEWEINPNKETY